MTPSVRESSGLGHEKSRVYTRFKSPWDPRLKQNDQKLVSLHLFSLFPIFWLCSQAGCLEWEGTKSLAYVFSTLAYRAEKRHFFPNKSSKYPSLGFFFFRNPAWLGFLAYSVHYHCDKCSESWGWRGWEWGIKPTQCTDEYEGGVTPEGKKLHVTRG